MADLSGKRSRYVFPFLVIRAFMYVVPVSQICKSNDKWILLTRNHILDKICSIWYNGQNTLLAKPHLKTAFSHDSSPTELRKAHKIKKEHLECKVSLIWFFNKSFILWMLFQGEWETACVFSYTTIVIICFIFVASVWFRSTGLNCKNIWWLLWCLQ